MTNKKVLYIYGRAEINAAKLSYMPFGINPVIKMAEMGLEIDLYLTQSQTNYYQQIFPSNVKVHFMDNKFIWGSGRAKRFIAKIFIYIFFKTFFKKYDIIWGAGQVGISLAGFVNYFKRVKLIYLSDEFAHVYHKSYWKKLEYYFSKKANYFIVPDESRLEITCNTVGLLPNKGFFFPNIPLSVKIQNKDWYKKLNISSNSKIILLAGGLGFENNVDPILSVFPLTPKDVYLVVVGKTAEYESSLIFNHSRIIFINQEFSDEEIAGLISVSTCCLGYYSDKEDLCYVGKSSGKIMRSLLIGTPVIATDFDSLKFIEEEKMGTLITKPLELIEAINYCIQNQKELRANIKNNIHKYYFNKYWNDFIIKSRIF